MPALTRILTPHGLQPAAYQADSLTDAAQYEPDDGIYTVTNTYNTTQVLKLDAHLNRLEDSARRENIPLQLDRPRLRAALRQLITEADFGDVRFRVTVGRDQPQHFILTLEPFTPPTARMIAEGVRCQTVPNSARKNAAAKTTDWMHERDKLAKPAGIYELFLRDADDYVLEGLGSNFYAILNGELRTAGAGVLPGIAQQIVFEVAPGIVPLRREALPYSQLTQASEAFMTSSSRGIVPISEIDGQAIGAGKPGPLTRRLREAYLAWMNNHLEEL